MSDRMNAIVDFLKGTNWADANIAPLAGDASNRRYMRLFMPKTGDMAVLMDAPSDKGEDVRPFVHIAKYLASVGLSPPRVFAKDLDQGFLILEDLGDDLFARVVANTPRKEDLLYLTATDALAALHQNAPPIGLGTYSPKLMADLAALAFDWYAASLTDVDPGTRAWFLENIIPVFETHCPDADVLIQRDYHAENLLWLPDRQGVKRVGLLDFQDALCGHRAYDLVSLLQDARRDVPAAVEATMIAHYVATTDQDATMFEAAYRVLGVQRNMRILGVFARLCIRDGKPHYIDLIPRVWDHLMADLLHPALSDVSEVVLQNLPEPTPENLSKLKNQCA